MVTSYFSRTENILLILAGVFYLASLFSFHYTKKINFSIIFLLVATLVLKLFQIHVDPFLNSWDEMFHALVAKNMASHPFKPTLYPDALLLYDFRDWTNNYIWVHKQPFYLWQMAFFIKLFGAKVWAVRLPSVLCFTFATYCVYKIGKNLTNQNIGYYGALFFSTGYIFGQLAVGAETTDHNDLVFITYVTASIWAFTEYINDPQNKKKWLIVIGVFGGVAVLTKWLVGLLVYLCWFFYEAYNSGKEFYQPKKYLDLLKSLAITVLIFIPWQIYIRLAFPKESVYESDYNNRHLFEPIEGHYGDDYFHIDKLNEMYGYLAPLLCVLGFVLMYRYFKSKQSYFAMIFTVIFVFCFFAWAATKMISFTMIVSCFFYLGFGAVAFALYEFLDCNNLKILKPLFLGAVIFLLFSSLKLKDMVKSHGMSEAMTFQYHARREQLDWENSCVQIAEKMKKEDKYVMFNCPEHFQNIRLMYYTDLIGYTGFPNKKTIEWIKEKGYKVAVFDNADLTPEILNNKDITVVTLPKFKVKQLDTVFIRPKNYEFLSFEWAGGRVCCNKKDQKTRMIIKTFEDGSSQLLLPEGLMATRDYSYKDNIIFAERKFSPTERFILLKTGQFEKKRGGLFTIRTADDVPVKVVEEGERIRATRKLGVDTFEIFVEKKKDEFN